MIREETHFPFHKGAMERSRAAWVRQYNRAETPSFRGRAPEEGLEQKGDQLLRNITKWNTWKGDRKPED